MLPALQASPSATGAALRLQSARTQDSQGGVGFLPGAPSNALRGRVELLLDATSLTAALLEAVHEARTSIKVDLHLLRGPGGQELARALARRARQGLRIQVLAWGPQTAAFDDLIQAARGLGLVVRRGATTAAPGGLGKQLVVDDRIALVGALGGPRAAKGRQGLLRLTGEAAWELGRQFNHDWAGSGGNPMASPDMAQLGLSGGRAQLRVGGNGPARAAARAVVLGALQRAKRSIELMADMVDDPQVLSALVQARGRGVAVRVLLSADASDQGGVLAAAGFDPRAAAIAALGAAGIPVRLQGGDGVLGLRAAVVDGDTMVLGSAAWTRAGLAGGGEVAVEVRFDAAVAVLRATFENDWETGSPAPLPGSVRRVAAALAPALAALSRLVSGRRWQVPDVRVGMVKMGGRWKLVTDVR